MSCAHSFGEYCSECINGIVADYNAARQENQRLAARLREMENTSDVDTYTPMLWATLNEDGKYVEYIRVRRRLTALRGALTAKAERWRQKADAENAHTERTRPYGSELYYSNGQAWAYRQVAGELDDLRANHRT